MTEPISGVCRYCGCTELTPCDVAPFNDGDTCAWLYGTEHTVRTGADCIQAHARDEMGRHFAAQAKRPPRLRSAEVHEAICKRRSRKKGAA